jgi:TonB-dependent SusC/RagA subfamily outer membrane receptor
MAAQAFSQTSLKVDADLNQVLVYRSGAELNHKAKLNLPAGSSEVVINNVANSIDEKTIQVGSNANVTILSVRFTKDYLKEEVESPEYDRLGDSIKSLQKIVAQYSNQRQAEESVLSLLAKNSDIKGANTGVSIAELMKLADYYKSKQLEVIGNVSKIDEQIATQQSKISKIQLQMLEMRTGKNDDGGQIVLQVIAKNAAPADFKISYISPNAGWSPFYNLRADKINTPLKLEYKANVVQNTGIDWKKVKLILSTGNPAVSGTAPNMAPVFLAFQQTYQQALSESVVMAYGPPVSKEKYVGSADVITAKRLENTPVSDITAAIEGGAPGVQMNNGGGMPGSGSGIQIRGRGSVAPSNPPLIVVDGAPYDGDITSIDPAMVASMNVLKDQSATSLYGSRGDNGVIVITTKNRTLVNYTTQTENDLNTTFDIDLPYDVESNAKPSTVALQEYMMPAHYQYMAIPKLDADVFLMADITGYEKLNLLQGEGNITFENMYVGKSNINPGSTNDTLNLSMGRDKQIVVKRDKIAELTGTKFLGSSRKQTFTYEIKVRNGKKDAVELMLKDQFPVSTDKGLQIELLQSDDATVNKETGELQWKLNIAPGETKKVRMSYSVQYANNKVVANL